jgi:hypothetical protein
MSNSTEKSNNPTTRSLILATSKYIVEAIQHSTERSYQIQLVCRINGSVKAEAASTES